MAAGIYDIGATLLGGLINGISNATTNAQTYYQQADLMNLQHSLNEESAENAYRRQTQMLDKYYTPQAQLEQMKAAGLSPSQILGGGAGTMGSTSAGGQQASTGLGSAPAQQLNILQGAQLAEMLASAELMGAKADTEKGDNKRGQLELAFKELENQMQDAQNYIVNNTKDFQVQEWAAKVDIAENSAWKILQDGIVSETQAKFDKETYQTRVKATINETEKIAAETYKAITGAEMNAETKKYIGEQIKFYGLQVSNEIERTYVERDKVEVAKEGNQIKTREVMAQETKNKIQEDYNNKFIKQMEENVQMQCSTEMKKEWLKCITGVITTGLVNGTQIVTKLAPSLGK